MKGITGVIVGVLIVIVAIVLVLVLQESDQNEIDLLPENNEEVQVTL